MAAIKQPLKDVMACLSGLLTAGGGPLFLYVRKYNDQFSKMKEGMIQAIPLPAALVEIIEPIEWNQMGGGLKQGDLTWKIHIGMEQLDAQDGTMEQNLDVFDQLRDPVVAGLSGFKPTACGLLFQTSESPDYAHTNFYAYVVTFKCGFIDSKGSPYDPNSGKITYTVPPTLLQVNNSVSHNPVADGIAVIFKGKF
jgi:hypothetical protein